MRGYFGLGPERDGLSPELMKRCGFVVRIPTAFSLNVGIAGAIVMYDRLISLGRFARRQEKRQASRQLPDRRVLGKVTATPQQRSQP